MTVEEQNDFIRANYATMPTKEMAIMLNISRDAISLRARKMGVRKAESRTKMPDNKVELLKTLFMEGLTNKQIAEKLGVHHVTVGNYIVKLGLVRQLWSDDELAILKANAGLSYRKISVIIGTKSWVQVEYMTRKMDLRAGVECERKQPKQMRIRELEQFKKDYASHSVESLMCKYDISKTTVRNVAKKYGLSNDKTTKYA